MLRRIWAVLQKELIQTLRDWRTLLIQLSIPMIQLFLFGYAISMNVEPIPTAVSDQSLDAASLAYVQALQASGYFDAVMYVPDQAGVVAAMDASEVQAGIFIPPDFAGKVARGEGQVLLLVDGSDIFTSQSAYNAATAVSQNHATDLLL
ncbi:MAG: ABC transporter permease, partial [Anaerolineales bacterium]|nr:ABC transporter permease [Anaerolineales bacterium]